MVSSKFFSEISIIFNLTYAVLQSIIGMEALMGTRKGNPLCLFFFNLPSLPFRLYANLPRHRGRDERQAVLPQAFDGGFDFSRQVG